jgi:hypothetical protein
MVQLSLDQLSTLDPDVAAAVRAQLGDEVLGRITTANRVEWIPVELQVAVNDALFAELSAEEYEAFWRRTGLASAQSSMFNRLVQGAMRLFGISPASIYKLFPRANLHVTRGLGEYIVTPTPHDNHVSLEWHTIAPALRGSKSWLASSKATMATPLDLLGFTGSVEFDAAEFEAGRVIYSIRWS